MILSTALDATPFQGPSSSAVRCRATRFLYAGFVWAFLSPGIAAAEPAEPPSSSRPSGDAATDLEEALALLRAGEYTACARRAAAKIEGGTATETWRFLKIRAELAVGAYSEALASLEDALRRYRSSLRLRVVGRDVYRYNGQDGKADELFEGIEDLARRNPWNYTDRDSRVTLGRVLLERGADARQVLELVYDRIKKEHPDYADAHVATGELALVKHDYAVATEALDRAMKLRPDDPDTLYLLARAHAPSDTPRAAGLLATALELNPNHVGSLLLRVEQLIDSEAYAPAEEVIAQVLAVNPRQPEAWAYRAVLAHLAGDEAREGVCRETALASWRRNPEVDHLIGRKLSQKYRFREGAAYQRRALTVDTEYLAAKLQLSQDLLRLGDEEEGWRLAGEVHDRDGYNVVAYNLSTLLEHLEKFRALSADGFIVRMEAREAEVYGERVLDLLGRARAHLLPRYEVELDEPVIVEIFPEQKDFAIRTFGLPGGAGFLGVCFGRVITANSPASQTGSPSNWEAVLWHEFCHVVTLTKTRNRMPRWLSEGISVYEERQADPAWGQTMTPQYREMVLGGELTPIGELSGAFLSPASPMHLQFAYYESSLVVEHIIDRYGLGALKQILTDLGGGMLIQDALARSTGSIEQVEREFAEFARARAEDLAPGADWTPPELPADVDSASLATWNAEHPDNIQGLGRYALQLMEEEKWEEAKSPLRRLVELHAESTGPARWYSLLAAVHRRLGETAEERAVLEVLASRESDAVDAYLRLMEIAAAEEDRDAVIANAERLLAVNPLIAAPHRELARAAEAAGDPERAIEAYRAQLLLDPVDPAGLNYRLASLYERTDDVWSARLHVLKALEEAPRYREAHRLLLALAPKLEEARKIEAARRIEEARRLEIEAKTGPPSTQEQSPDAPESGTPATSAKEKRF